MSNLVSIITPCLNSESTIERTVLSVLNQSYRNIQYLVIDGQSSDRTLEILQKYQQTDARLFVVSEKDSSMTEALNRGLQLTQGDVIATLNADDWYEPSAIANVIQRYQLQPFECLMANTRFVSTTGQTLYTAKPWVAAWPIAWQLMGCITPESSVFYSAECVKKVGLFNETLRYTQDLEYYLRILRYFRISYLDQLLSNFYISPDQYSNRLHERMEAEVLSYVPQKRLRKIIGGTHLGSLARVLLGVRSYDASQFFNHSSNLIQKKLVASIK